LVAAAVSSAEATTATEPIAITDAIAEARILLLNIIVLLVIVF